MKQNVHLLQNNLHSPFKMSCYVRRETQRCWSLVPIDVASLGPAHQKKHTKQWWLWRMMDVPSANQSQTNCQTWAGYNGWSPASPPGPIVSPVPTFQHLNLGSDQTPSYNQSSNQGSLSSTFPSQNNTHHITLSSYNVDLSVQHDASSASNLVKNTPLCSLPLMNDACHPHHSPHPAITPPHTHQALLNGPHQTHLPFSPQSFGQCSTKSPQCAPQPLYDRAGFIHDPPTSPIQQQAPWTLPPNNRGIFIAVWHECFSKEVISRRQGLIRW